MYRDIKLYLITVLILLEKLLFIKALRESLQSHLITGEFSMGILQPYINTHQFEQGIILDHLAAANM